MNIPRVSTAREARNVCRRLFGDFVTQVISTPQSFGVGILERNGKEGVRVIMRHRPPILPVTLQPGTRARAADADSDDERIPPLTEALREFFRLCLDSGDPEVRKVCARVLKDYREKFRERARESARSFAKRFSGDKARGRSFDRRDEITRLNNFAKAAHRGGRR